MCRLLQHSNCGFCHTANNERQFDVMDVGIVIARPRLQQQNPDLRVHRQSMRGHAAAHATANHDVIKFPRCLPWQSPTPSWMKCCAALVPRPEPVLAESNSPRGAQAILSFRRPASTPRAQISQPKLEMFATNC